jgi:predicted ATPase/class 3 adenylate cyclase
MAQDLSKTMAELPSGTVTFLFTDIEGSTQLLRELGDRYTVVLAEHRRVLREAFDAHGGVEVDTQGDAFFYVFGDAPEAVEAAAAAQAALSAGPVRVRMGVHTGTPELSDEGYVGLDVHLGARIAAAGHGGQVLLSKAVRELVDVDLRDLGEHRLKDFGEPVWIFQFGSESFPPLRTISNTNLPRPASAFVGRERERGEVVALLRSGARLLTLTGPGGSGKTRLAIEAAAELVSELKNGVFWVGLAPLRDPGLVIETIADTLGARDGLPEHVGERELLLLVDNLEQVVEAAPTLATLVESCPNLRLLATSRELLRVRGEVEYPVLPLVDRDAVGLFCARSGAQASETVEEFCRRLDNLPLALELAAARTSVLLPGQILERLSERLDLLKGGRDADPRQQTLRATIAWSYELLPPEEQQLFARLAVFGGGCTVEAATAVARAELDDLQSLVDKNLVRRTGERFWMLETIREYALERLDESGQASPAWGRLAAWVLALAREAGPQLTGPHQAEWLERIDAERDNVRAALEWAFGNDNADLALEVAVGLGRFWWVRGAAEGLGWLERGLQRRDLRPEVRAMALEAAGGTAWFLGDRERAQELFEAGLAIFRELGDRAGTAMMLTRLAPPLIEGGHVEEGERLVEEAVSMNRELGQKGELALSLSILGAAAHERRELQKANELLEESAALAQQVGDYWQVAWNLHMLADVALQRDDLGRALSLSRDGLIRAQEIGDDLAVLICLGILAIVAKRSGEERRAGVLWGVAERLDEEIGETLWRATRRQGDEMLGERGADFELGVEEGRRLPLGEVLALALRSD